MKFGKKLQLLAKQRNVSQEKLAAVIGKSQGQISNYMIKDGGEAAINLENALKLARFLGVSLDYLADPDVDAKGDEELSIEREIRRLVERLGVERAYSRLIKADDDPRGGGAAPAPRYGESPGPRMGSPDPNPRRNQPGKGSRSRRSLG